MWEMKEERGFTLIELLIVITILGILAGIVVFAVSGISSKGQTEACNTDKSQLLTAEQTYFALAANNSTYANELGLKNAGLLASFSTLFDVGAGSSQPNALTNATATGGTDPETAAVVSQANYAIAIADTKCGTAGTQVYP